MAIKRGKLEFQNVLSMKTRCYKREWSEKVKEFKRFIINNDLFVTGPFMIRWEEIDEDTEETEMTIYFPVYHRISLTEDKIFYFQEKFCILDGLKIRHMEIDEEDEKEGVRPTELVLDLIAEKMGVQLEKPYYYIYLPVYGEYVIDIYAPIEKGESEYDFNER